MNYINYQQGELHIENQTITSLASRYPTPFYCYSANTIRDKYHKFHHALNDLNPMICYAIKANSNQAILTLLGNLGAGADVVSEGELRRALAAGISADKIVFSGVAKTSNEIEFALNQGIFCFNVESTAELRQISAIATRNNQIAKISLRINPDVDAGTHAKISTGKSENKFGIPFIDALCAYQLANELMGLKICGIDMHIGSQIHNVNAFDKAIDRLAQLIEQLAEINIVINHIDFGGGLGVRYNEGDKSEQVLLEEYAQVIHKHAARLNCQFIFEPGRFITANAGLLVTQVIHVKPVEKKTFVIVDAAMNDLIRPTLYDAWHDITPAKEPIKSNSNQLVDIVGPVCESGDYLAKDREFSVVKAGDILVVHSAGAYCAVSSNTYNTRRLIAEVLVDGDKDYLIRPSPSYEQLIALDKVPSWL